MNVYGLRQDSKGYVAVIMKILENLKKDKERLFMETENNHMIS